MTVGPEVGCYLVPAVNLVVTDKQQIATSFSGWFTFGDAPGQAPSNWKQSMIVLLTLYPIVMLEQMFLNPLLHSLGMAEATFIGNLLSVAALT